MKHKLILSILACGASLALCPVSHAQDASPSPATTGTEGGHQWGHHGGGGPGMMLQHLTTELNLTADQQAKIKPILDDASTKIQALRGDTTLSQQDKMAKMKDIMDSRNSQITALLTADQQTKFAALQQKMHNRRRGGGGPDAQASPSASPSASPQ